MDTSFNLNHVKSIILALLLWYSSYEKGRVALHEKEGKALTEHPGGHILHLADLPGLSHCQLGHLLICYSAPRASAAGGMKLNL